MKPGLTLLASALTLIGAGPPTAQAAALTDGSVGAVQSLAGRFTVPQSLGTVRGANLFHSFTRFGIGVGESATFSTTDAGLRHVISRVTGGEASVLQGPLKLDAAAGSRPDFWFINPSGITVGAGASFDVPAGLHLSTAQQLRFGDGFSWDARSGTASTLSVATPESFGFLGPQAAAALSWRDADLTLRPGSLLELAAGSVAIERSNLSTPGGSIRVTAPGKVELSDGGFLSATTGPTAGSGAVHIQAGELSMDRRGGAAAGMRTEMGADAQIGAVDIDLQVTGHLLVANGASITAANSSTVPGGRLRITAGSMTAQSPGPVIDIGSEVMGRGNGAAVEVSMAGRLMLIGNAQINSSTAAFGDSGAVRVRAGSLDLDGRDQFALVGTAAFAGSSGNAGPVNVGVQGSLQLRGGGQIMSTTSGAGNSGAVNLRTGSVEVFGADASIFTSAQVGSSGNAGSVDLAVQGSLQVLGGGLISSQTFGTGNGGPVSLSAGSVEVDGQGSRATVLTAARAGSSGSAGSVAVMAQDAIMVLDGGEIRSFTQGTGSGGPVTIHAGSLQLGGRGRSASITTEALGNSSGNAGSVGLKVQGRLNVLGAGLLASTTAAAGDGGSIDIQAGALTADGQGAATYIFTEARPGSTGSAGSLSVAVSNSLTVQDGAQISSYGQSGRSAARITLDAGSMRLDRKGSATITGIYGVGTSALRVNVSGDLDVSNGAGIEAQGIRSFQPGELTVRARNLTLEGRRDAESGIRSFNGGPLSAQALSVEVSERLLLRDRSRLGSEAQGTGNGAAVNVSAPVIEMTGGVVNGSGFVAVIGSGSSGARSGHAGDVSVQTSSLGMRSGTLISSTSSSTVGNAGNVSVRADDIVLDGAVAQSSILSEVTSPTSVANAGSIVVHARNGLTLRDGATIVAGAAGSGNPGAISVAAASLLIDGSNETSRRTGISGQALARGVGAGASVTVDAARIQIRGGLITSDTSTSRAAGSVQVNAGILSIVGDGAVNTGRTSGIGAGSSGSGKAGDLTIRAREILVENGGQIYSSTLSSGHGGSISIEAERLTLQESAVGAITRGSGDAGNIDVHVTDALVLRNAAGITAHAEGAGAAGSVNIKAGSFFASTDSLVASSAIAGSGGQPGSVTLTINGLFELRDDAGISISNLANVADASAIMPTTLRISAGQIRVSASQIAAASFLNANSGRIVLDSVGDIRLDSNSFVATSAAGGNGGPISVNAGGTVRLIDSAIATSVVGSGNGNGGDITVTANALLLQSGFIQANTSGRRAKGGEVSVNVGTLLPNASNVFIGGNRVESFRAGLPGFNVIQAAAPDGVSGRLDVTLPQLNLSGSLIGLSTARIDFGLLSPDQCFAGGDSSFTKAGRGGLIPRASQALTIEP